MLCFPLFSSSDSLLKKSANGSSIEKFGELPRISITPVKSLVALANTSLLMPNVAAISEYWLINVVESFHADQQVLEVQLSASLSHLR